MKSILDPRASDEFAPPALDSDVRVRLAGEEDAPHWERYIARHPQATSDHRWGWRVVLQGTFGFRPLYLIAWARGQVVGTLPLFVVPRGFGRGGLCSIPFGNYGGVCADSDEASHALLQAAIELLEQCRASYVELRHRAPLAHGSLHARHLHSRFVCHIEGDLGTMQERIGSGNRSKLRKAQRDGASVVISRDVRPLYRIHQDTMRRLGTPCFPRGYFESTLRVFPDATIHYVHAAGAPVAYYLTLMFRDTLLCQFSGSLEAFHSLQPNTVLAWHAIEVACRARLRLVDHGRSRMGSGAAHFKRTLRLEEEPLAYQYVLRRGGKLPERHPANPRYRTLIAAWRRLPRSFSASLGPRLVKYFA